MLNLTSPVTKLASNPNICDCTVMYQFQSDASGYYYIGLVVGVAACLIAFSIGRIVKKWQLKALE